MKKLLELQKNIGKVVKDSKNPYFKSKYFDINGLLSVLKPELNKLDLVVIQPLQVNEQGKLGIKTEVFDGETGTALVSSYVTLPENPDPQKMGAIITYFRRYALTSLFLLEAEDDDGNSAGEYGNKVDEIKHKARTGEPIPVTDYQDFIEDNPQARTEVNEEKKAYKRSPEYKSTLKPRVEKEEDEI